MKNGKKLIAALAAAAMALSLTSCVTTAEPTERPFERRGEGYNEDISDKYHLSMSVSPLAGGDYDWQASCEAHTGEVIRFRVHLANISSSTIENITIRDTIPPGCLYMSGSTLLSYQSSDEQVSAPDGIEGANGLTIESLEAGDSVYIYFSAVVDNYASIGSTLTSEVNVAIGWGAPQVSTYVEIQVAAVS